MAKVDWDSIRHALELARANGYAEVTIADGEMEFEATLEPAPKAKKSPAALPEAQAPAAPETLDVTSTLVGFYQSGKKPLEVGQTIAKGDIVAAVQALGITTEVESNVSGEVVEVLVQPGDAVMFGQALARVKP